MQWEMFKSMLLKCGVPSNRLESYYYLFEKYSAQENDYKQQLLNSKLKKSFIEQVQWKLHYDLGYPAARVAGVKERISEMFESNQADIDKSAAEIVEYFERFNKE